MASTSSTPPLPRRQINYDVFLSFRGTDVGKTFVGHLYNKLVETGIRTFKDDGELEKGQRIEELLQIIKESQFAIVVFSQDYASAKWCLEEVATIMECQQQYGEEIIIPIFYDVEPSVVRNQTKSFAESFKRHEENTEKAKVEWWKEALKKAGQISGYHYYHLKNDFNGFEAKCVQPVVDETHQLLLKVFVFNFVRFEAKCVQPVVDEIYARLNQSNLASTVLEKNLVGLDSRVGAIGKLLRMEPNDAQFIGIWGMGGIGKTTIAQIVLKRFSSQFDGVCFLANIRENQGEMIELQKTLIETILKGPLDNISNVHDGMEVIMTRFKEKKVLIVLDDVDLVGQLQKLAGDCDWFGGGSRVIITTRDVGILRSHGVDKKYIYKVETLGFEEAIQLFRLHAFKQKVKTGMEQLCQLVVHYCKGLPLALKIVGSSLCGLEVADWERTLEKLKDTPYGDIHGMLKISFDRLDPKNKKIFLHIACFFRHEKEEYVKNVLKSCDLHPVIGMRVLIEKSLISVTEFGRIEMHDIIQDMGWHIARQENPRSRVWELKEVDDVLCGKMELTKHIECISFPYNTYGLWPHNYENISSAFEALKILIGKWPWSFNEEEDNKWPRSFKHGYSHSIKEDDGMDNYQQLPSSLRWLHFPDYPFRSLPTSFHPSSMDTNPSELVGLCLHRSSLQNCWMTKELNKLTYLDLSLSYSLLETPNFAMMPNLRSLDLSHCSKLKEIHPSVERLEKLVLLDVSYCIKLEKLPSFIQVSSLQFLKLEYCLELENFPEIQASMPLVPELNLKSIPIRELPSSIQQLCGLTKLSLSFCEHLEYLPNNLCELKSLKVMKLESCKKLESLPENLGYLSKLEELYIFDTVIFQLPSSVTQLSSLECLCWGHKFGYCESSLKFVHSVSSLRSLKRLQLHNFKNIDEGLPSDLGRCLISLEYLNLQGSNFGYLPKSFSQFPHLQYLDIRDCEKLEKLPKLPKTIRELYVDSHFAFRNKSINIAMLAIKYPMLYSVSFSSRDEYDSFRGETILAKKSIQFPFQRMTPFSVSYSSYSFYGDNNNHYAFLRSFKYRRYKSDRISFNLNPNWYSTQFVGFAVYFVSSQADIRRPRSYQGFDDHTHHYVIKAKLSSYNDIKKEDLETKCVIAGSTYYKCTHNCFVYLPFSSLWPESKPMMEANDYSRFEVDLEASADWGINLLYKSPIGAREHGEEEGAREHIANYHRSDSGLLTTNDIGCLTSLESEIEYLNHGSKNLDSLPAYYSQLHSLRYFDISGCGKLKELPELPTTIRELYANSNLASESNIAKLATKYPKLYSISFSCTDKRVTFSPVELARKFAHAPFQIMRNSSFIVTYPIGYCSTDRDMTKWFKYSSHDSNKISISLKPSWHNQSFVGFVVCFILNSRDDGIWKSCPDGRPFRYGEVIAQLVHKDNEQVLQTNCVIGRQCDEEIDDVFMDSQIICFAYIPFLSLFNNKSRDTPSDYLVFEVGFGEAASNASTDWSCGLLYKNDESLSEAIWSKTIATSHDNGDSDVENEEEEEDGISQHTEDSGGDDAMVEDSNSSGHSAELPIDISDDESEPSEYDDSGEEGESIDGDEDVEEYESDAEHSSGCSFQAFEENLVGLESRVNNIGNWLRLVCDDDDDARFIGICGTRGIGKTTIAMAIFNKFSSQFDGACFLTDVRQHNTIELQKTLITTIPKDKSGVEISSVQDGMLKIRISLQGKKVLIVLDDVDGTEQLEKLVGGGDWFGRDSRLIITTRDAAVLLSYGVVEKYIYEVQTLEKQEAIQLFRWHAFKKKPAKTGEEELCGSIVDYCKGLPLALKVLGSSLCGLEAGDWESTLEELKGTPNDDIDSKLKICFDRLDSNSKNIFLYIACFFRHEREEYVKDVLKSCDLQPVIGIHILIEKSLISILEGRIEMHDLIQEMGWHIASLDRPRSRVWQLKDVDDVLSGKMDPKHKEGILLPSAGDINEENISELKWLDFKFYPFTSLPESFIPSKLVWFSLHHSYLVNCRINQKLDKLIYLDLNSSYSLLETPDFDSMPNLMSLNLSDCQKLKRIHSSIGNLKKLILLDISKCNALERLPDFNQVSSLRSLNLLGCIRLKDFPNIRARTPHLGELDLKMVGIKELSSSIQNLHGLTKLCLGHCPHLVRLCNGLCELKTLKVLEIKNCRNLKSLPEKLEGLISLEYLNFQGCCFDSLPESFSQLTCLQYLSITDCEIPKELPKLPANIKELYADCGVKIAEVAIQNIKELYEDCGFKIAELAIQYSKLNLVSFSTGDQHGLAKKFIHFPLHRKTPFCVSYDITNVDLEKSKILRTFKYRHYKSNEICINLESSWYSEKFMGFVVCFSEKKGNIWGRHLYQAIDNSIRSCTVIVKLSHKDNKDKVLQTACVIAVSSFDNSDIYGTICCAYIPVSSLLGGESKALKDYSRFEVQFMNVEASADWGCSLLYERQIGATKHKDNHDGTDSEHKTDDIGCLSSLGLGTEYLNLNRRDLICLPKLTHLQYLDISGSRRLIVLPKLPTTIKELYAHSNLASESNIAKLSIMYPELYSVSFSYGYATVSAEELARKFVRVPFQIRNSPFVVTYPACDDLADIDTKRWFKYTSHCSNEVSINLKSSWYNEIFMGFVVCFLLQGRPQGWESHPDILPFRHYKVIAKLIHKDNANEFLQTDCVIGRLYDEEFDDEFEDCQFICFAYIPSSSLLSKYEGDPNDYSVFKVAFLDSSNSSDWSCGLLYENDELLSEAVRSNIYTDTLKSQQLDPHITKSWQLTKIVHQYQCQMVSMPECFDAKVVRLLYTKFGVGIMALGVDGILKLWKWPHNKQNPSAKATVNFVPQYWQTNSGLLIDVSGVNIKEVFPCIALSNDGYFVALAIGGKVSLFNMNTIRFKEMTTFKLPSASTCLAHDPCAYETIAIGAEDSTIYLYNFAKEKVMTELKGHHDRITGLAFSTNPYMLVSSGADAQLCVWNNIGSWRKRISVRIQLPGEVFSGDTQVMFHVDQLHLLVTHETQLAIYDTSMMECISQWIPHGSLSTPISSATYSSNSLLVYASFNDGNIGVFDAHSLRLRCCIAPSAYLSQIVPDRIRGVYPVAIAAHPQKTNQFAIGLTNGSVKVIEPREFERKWGVSLTIDNDPIQCRMVSMPECFDAKVKVAQILYTKSGVDILALSSNGFYKLWKWFHHEQNPSRKATANSLPQHWQTYSGLHVSVVNLVEVVPCIALSNDGSFVALAAGEKVSLFDMETFEEKVTFICQSASTFLAFHPRHNNILAIGMEDSTINIYNAWDKEVMVNLKGAQKRITGLAFSTNLEMLVSSGADARLCAWSIDTWEMRISVPIQLPASELEVPSRDTHVMFHADQLHLLVTHETQLAIYDASKMECISQWIPHDCLCAPISSATYSCNNQLVYASFKDGNIGVLDFDKPNSLRLRCRIAPFAYLSKVNSDGVYAVVIAAHPQEPYQLAIGLTDGSVKVIEPLESEGEWRISPPVDIETLNEDEDDESDEDVEEYEAKESNAGNSVELAAEYNDSERIDDDEEASITEKSVKDAALFGEIHEPNPIIWKDHNYHIEEDHETTTSQHELGPNKIKQWEFTAIVDRDQCRMVSMSDCFDAKVVRLFYTNSGVSILALSSDGIQKLWKWLNNEQNPTGKATANYVPQNWQSNSGLLMINDVVGVDLENVVPCIALSNDDSYIVSSVGGKVSLFNIMTFEVTKTITLPSASTFLAFDPHDDNIIAIGTEKSTIYIYDRIDEELNELGEHHKPITGLAFSTNLKLLVSSDADAQLCSWNTRLWRKKRSVRIQLPAGEVCSGDTHVMFHVDQLHLLVTHETQLAIYDASKMERINQWIPNGSFSAPISCATYSCNCQLIYATLKDGNIGVFDAHGLRPRCCIAPCAYLSQVILNRSESVYAVAIAAHPQYPNQFAIGLTDGSVKVIEPLESQRQWGISPPVDIEILNAAEKSVLTQLELGTGEAEQIKPNPANEDCEAKVHSNKCALIRCFWKCC